MVRMYCIRGGEVVQVLPLRGRVFARWDEEIEERNGKRYAINPKAEFVVNHIYTNRAEAERVARDKGAAKARKKEREQKEWQNYLAERDILINRLMKAAEVAGVEVSGVGFALNEEIEREILRVENMANDK